MDARGGRATVGTARLENGHGFDRPEIKTDRASHTQTKGHLEQTPAGRGLRAKGNRARMATGTLKMWNAERGYGFIADDAGGPDMLLHISALEAAGIDPANLRKGDRLSFEVEGTHDGRTMAGNVRRSG